MKKAKTPSILIELEAEWLGHQPGKQMRLVTPMAQKLITRGTAKRVTASKGKPKRKAFTGAKNRMAAAPVTK